MNFCTIEELRSNLTDRVLVQLTDDSSPASTVNTALCGDVIAQASELMEGRLGARYADLSALTATPLLRRICIDICTYYLYSRRNKGSIENVRTRYEDALKELDTIKIGQSGVPSQSAAPEAGYKSSRRRSDRVFGTDSWGAF